MKFTNLFKLLNVALVLVILVSAIPASVHAARGKSDSTYKAPLANNASFNIFLPVVNQGLPEYVADTLAKKNEFEQAILEMEQSLIVNEDGTIDFIGILSPSHDQELQLELLKALDETNAMIESGELDIEEVSLNSQAESIDDEIEVLGCRGRSDYKWYWWGSIKYYNSCQTQGIIHTLTVAAGTAGFLSTSTIATTLGLSAPVSAALATGAAGGALTAGSISAIHWYGGNEGIYVVSWPGGAYLWCQ